MCGHGAGVSVTPPSPTSSVAAALLCFTLLYSAFCNSSVAYLIRRRRTASLYSASLAAITCFTLLCLVVRHGFSLIVVEKDVG